LQSCEDGLVRYTWRDRSDDNVEKVDELPVEEFIRRGVDARASLPALLAHHGAVSPRCIGARLLYHILPPGFKGRAPALWGETAPQAAAPRGTKTPQADEWQLRYYGFLSNAKRKHSLSAIRAALGAPAPPPVESKLLPEIILERTGVDITRCPACGRGTMLIAGVLSPDPAIREPPGP
jgi:hypothetical protein